MHKAVLTVAIVTVFACGFVAGYYCRGNRRPVQDTAPSLVARNEDNKPQENEATAKMEQLLREIEEKDRTIAALQNEILVLKQRRAKKEEVGRDIAKTLGKPDQTKEQPTVPGKPDLATLAHEAKADPLNRELVQRYLAEALRNGAEACVEAVELYKEALKADPESAHAHYNLGMAYLYLLDCMQAETSMEAAIKMGKLAASAIEEFGKALEIDPNDFDALLARGITNYFFPGKMKDSVADLERLAGMAKDKNPEEKYAQGYLWLGKAYRGSGNSEKALETIREGCRLFPQNESLQNELLRMEKK